jgi:predicted dehydrogenase
MSAPFTVATIGCGAIAQALHLPGYHKRADVGRIVGVDPDPARLSEVTDRFRMAATYADYRDMLAHERPDFVSVCTPNALHAEHAIAALEAGAHLLLEKPMALTLDEAQAITAAAAQAGKQVMIGFSHRLYRGNQTIKRLLDAGAIGEPFMIRVRFAHMGPFPGWAKSDWFYDPQMAGGGALLDMGIHAIDLCQWLLGPIASVAAQMATLRKPIAVDDNAVLALAFAGRALGYIEVGWTSGPGFLGLEIYGDNGSIIHDYAHGLRVCTGKATPDAAAPPDFTWELLDDASTTGGWSVEIDHFMDTILAGQAFAMDPHAGIASLAVALAAMESARSGQRVDVG